MTNHIYIEMMHIKSSQQNECNRKKKAKEEIKQIKEKAISHKEKRIEQKEKKVKNEKINSFKEKLEKKSDELINKSSLDEMFLILFHTLFQIVVENEKEGIESEFELELNGNNKLDLIIQNELEKNFQENNLEDGNEDFNTQTNTPTLIEKMFKFNEKFIFSYKTNSICFKKEVSKKFPSPKNSQKYLNYLAMKILCFIKHFSIDNSEIVTAFIYLDRLLQDKPQLFTLNNLEK